MSRWARALDDSREHIARWQSIVHARLPRSGIGNSLLIWARAHVFADRNRLPWTATGWATPRLGPWLRREERKRIYVHYFRPGSPLLWARARLLARAGREVLNPSAGSVLSEEERRGVTFSFTKIPDTGGDYFKYIRECRSSLRDDIAKIASPYCRWRMASVPAPVIGVHVRCGDFRPLQPGEDLGYTTARTPLDFFCAVIQGIREIAGRCLPATVFSDGTDEQLAQLLALPLVARAPKNPDLVDLLSLGRSRIVVGSAHSTFSQWGGFLSDGPFVRPIVTNAPGTRDSSCGIFDGGIEADPAQWPALLVENIGRLASR